MGLRLSIFFSFFFFWIILRDEVVKRALGIAFVAHVSFLVISAVPIG